MATESSPPKPSHADLHALNPEEFEELVAQVFKALGFAVKITRRTGDGGIDLELRRNGEFAVAQCKRYKGTIGEPQLRDFYGAMQHEGVSRGYFVTSGTFSLAAQTWCLGKGIALVDGADLVSSLSNVEITPSTRHLKSEQIRGLCKVVRESMSDPRERGRILIRGNPPVGSSYAALADFLFWRLRPSASRPGAVVTYLRSGRTHDVSRWREKWTDSVSWPDKWSGYDPASLTEQVLRDGDDYHHEKITNVLFLDEFDGLPRKLQDAYLNFQQDGSSDAFPRDIRFLWTYSFIIATAWEKRIPAVVRGRFSIELSASEIEWEAVRRSRASRARWREGLLEAAVQRERKRLAERQGRFCLECRIFEEDSFSDQCRNCRRRLGFRDGEYLTLVSGFFGESWHKLNSSHEDVIRAKTRYVDDAVKAVRERLARKYSTSDFD